jgi:hypothetical protein
VHPIIWQLIVGDAGVNLTNLKLLQTELTLNDAMDAYEALVIRNAWQNEMSKAMRDKHGGHLT